MQNCKWNVHYNVPELLKIKKKGKGWIEIKRIKCVAV